VRIFHRKFRHFPWLILLGISFPVQAQHYTKYAIFFTDKPSVDFPYEKELSPHTLERNQRQNRAPYDWFDLPVNTDYLQGIVQAGARIRMHSRWLNAAVALLTEDEKQRIEQLAYVKELVEMSAQHAIAGLPEQKHKGIPSGTDTVVLHKQLSRMGEAEWRKHGMNGKGIRIAIFDAGFSDAQKNPAFDYLRANKRIISTWDFVDRDESVWHGSNHGTGVWSCIGGLMGEQPVGLAWDAEYLLARTENEKTEPFSEEENWVAAAEWAYKNGADIINSSLGYTDKRYFKYQMDGKSTFVSRGANIAARKGMLVVNAAGNEGNGPWSIVGAPADADSVLTIGGVEICCDYHIPFSSYGPTWDFRLKPNLSAQGDVICARGEGLTSAQGTSFASPLVAGFAACAWQYRRELRNMDLFRLLEKSGSLFPYYDYAHGYGIPTASRITGTWKADTCFLLEHNAQNDSIFIRMKDEIFPKPEQIGEVDSEQSYSSETGDLLYYQLVKPNGLIEKYSVVWVNSVIPLRFARSDYAPGQKIRVYCKGQFEEFEF